MNYPPSFRAGRMLWRFRRSGGKGAYTQHTRPFTGFPEAVRARLSGDCSLGPDEIPVIASFHDQQARWVLLTTARLIWSIAGQTSSIPWSSLHNVVVPPEEPETARSPGSAEPSLCRLQIQTAAGLVHEVEFEPGPPFVAFSHTLAVLASQNRFHRP